MDLAQLIYSVLATGAGLASAGAVSEFGKSAGKSAFNSLKDRLEKVHGLKSLPLIEDAEAKPEFKSAILSELQKPDIASDIEVLKLIEELREAILSLPEYDQRTYAVDVKIIRSGGSIVFDAVEGVKSQLVSAKDEISFKNITSPPGK